MGGGVKSLDGFIFGRTIWIGMDGWEVKLWDRFGSEDTRACGEFAGMCVDDLDGFCTCWVLLSLRAM